MKNKGNLTIASGIRGVLQISVKCFYYFFKMHFKHVKSAKCM